LLSYPTAQIRRQFLYLRLHMSSSIHDAAREGNADSLKQLLDSNPEWVDELDEKAKTPLMLAAM
jgi:ankyrin repeat protein